MLLLSRGGSNLERSSGLTVTSTKVGILKYPELAKYLEIEAAKGLMESESKTKKSFFIKVDSLHERNTPLVTITSGGDTSTPRQTFKRAMHAKSTLIR